MAAAAYVTMRLSTCGGEKASAMVARAMLTVALHMKWSKGKAGP